MKIKILSPLWGHEQMDMQQFLDQINAAGYDGMDTWIPDRKADKHTLLNYLQKHEMYLVAHQHAAEGSTFKKFSASFAANLKKCADASPLLINSHTGKDHFSLQQFLDLISVAQEFSEKTGIKVTHETHRGRMGYAPQITADLFQRNKTFILTADFSHWVCVTESMLENFGATVKEAIQRSRHIHARIGFEQGPQVPDPRAAEWQYALDHFLNWWDEIVSYNQLMNTSILPITTEFGPAPYMPLIPFSKQPVADQFTINCFMKDLLHHRYHQYH